MGVTDPAGDAVEIGGLLPAARIDMTHSGCAHDEPGASQEAAGEQEPGIGQGDVAAAAGRLAAAAATRLRTT